MPPTVSKYKSTHILTVYKYSLTCIPEIKIALDGNLLDKWPKEITIQAQRLLLHKIPLSMSLMEQYVRIGHLINSCLKHMGGSISPK